MLFLLLYTWRTEVQKKPQIPYAAQMRKFPCDQVLSSSHLTCRMWLTGTLCWKFSYLKSQSSTTRPLCHFPIHLSATLKLACPPSAELDLLQLHGQISVFSANLNIWHHLDLVFVWVCF